MGEKKKNWRKGICGIALLFAGMGAFGVETAEAAGKCRFKSACLTRQK